MAVTIIPNVTNWSVTPRNGQVGYFILMNTWLSESTVVIASLQTAINAQNTANSEINDLAIQTENNANIAASVGNYQGVWSNLVTYSKSMGVSVGNLYYISKVDSNLNHAVTDTNYWLYNPINDKLDKDFSVLADKTTPSDSDIFATRETGGLLKKISWANSKATLKTYFDTLYLALTGNQTVNGVKTFSSSPIVPTPTTNTQAANKAYVDTKQANLGFAPVQQATGIGQVDSLVKIGWSGYRTKITIDSTDMGNIVMDSNIGVANSELVKTALNASGSAPIYACRAWVNFNGTGTVAIRASGNVSSITDNGVGYYTVNFTVAMPDANYSEIVGSGVASIAPVLGAARSFCTGNRLSTAISVVVSDNNVDNPFDNEVVNVSIFR